MACSRVNYNFTNFNIYEKLQFYWLVLHKSCSNKSSMYEVNFVSPSQKTIFNNLKYGTANPVQEIEIGSDYTLNSAQKQPSEAVKLKC